MSSLMRGQLTTANTQAGLILLSSAHKGLLQEAFFPAPLAKRLARVESQEAQPAEGRSLLWVLGDTWLVTWGLEGDRRAHPQHTQ